MNISFIRFLLYCDVMYGGMNLWCVCRSCTGRSRWSEDAEVLSLWWHSQHSIHHGGKLPRYFTSV